jgi:IS1 family transposase
MLDQLSILLYNIVMNRLTKQKQIQIVSALVEGCSMRSVSRMVDVSINTVVKLLRDLGKACDAFQNEKLTNLSCKRLQVDEIWSFCYSKQKNVPKDHVGEFGYGDVWTWTAICADTKLVPCWHVGRRSAEDAALFISDLHSRLKDRIQLTSDGLHAYLNAVEESFGCDIDYAMLVKLYGSTDPSGERRYSPAEYAGSDTKVIYGFPNPDDISTSFVERQNLTMRMSMRRFTRLTNGFSKKVENHMAAISLHFMYYNFCRIHKTLRVTPAMEAGVSDHPWTVEEMIELIN